MSEQALAREALVAEEKASKLLADLCAGRHRFTMSVPARPNEDTDLVIGEALSYIPKLAALLRAPAADPAEMEALDEAITMLINFGEFGLATALHPLRKRIHAVEPTVAAAEPARVPCPKCRDTGTYRHPGWGSVICDCRDLLANMGRGLSHLPRATPTPPAAAPSSGSGAEVTEPAPWSHGPWIPPDDGHGSWGCRVCGYAKDMHAAAATEPKHTGGCLEPCAKCDAAMQSPDGDLLISRIIYDHGTGEVRHVRAAATEPQQDAGAPSAQMYVFADFDHQGRRYLYLTDKPGEGRTAITVAGYERQPMPVCYPASSEALRVLTALEAGDGSGWQDAFAGPVKYIATDSTGDGDAG